MSGINVKVEDNSGAFLQELAKRRKEILDLLGDMATNYAKEDCPVDTGKLRDSITHTTDEQQGAVYVGTDVEYAPFVEYMDNRQHTNGKAHFLRNAVSQHQAEYEEIIKRELKK